MAHLNRDKRKPTKWHCVPSEDLDQPAQDDLNLRKAHFSFCCLSCSSVLFFFFFVVVFLFNKFLPVNDVNDFLYFLSFVK